MTKNDLWVERYRPKDLDSLVLDETTRTVLVRLLKEGTIPHLLLAGNVGCGKTTIAKILIDKLDCDSLSLNASDERGIDTVRNKIKQFAMIQSIKKWKIVFLDEADALTPEAQFSLRNIFETYSEQTRFVLTCNYLNRVIEPLRSRCQVVLFDNLHRKHILQLLKTVLAKESIEYEQDSLMMMIDTFYPDIRSMINNLQMYSTTGKWKFSNIDSFRSFEKLLTLLKSKDFKSIRALNIDYVEAFRYMFDKVDELTEDYEKSVELSLIIADYLYRDMFIPDKMINFVACCMAVARKIDGTV